MLLVILGAGASFDSVQPVAREKLLIPRRSRERRPPLARELFDDREPFNRALQAYGCIDLAAHLRGVIQNRDKDLEAELERLKQQAPTYEPYQRQLLGLRFYLQSILWECSQWGDEASGITNYGALLSRIDRHRKDEQVCIVTFNYDTLVEQALVRYKSEGLTTLDDLISGDYKLFKLHGSADWGREIRETYGQHLAGDPLRVKIIERGSYLPIGDVLVKQDAPEVMSSYGHPLLPAISIPVQGKTTDSFECPKEHVSMLQACMSGLRKILVIGWRGGELCFLDLLSRPHPQYPHVMVVADSERNAESTAAVLKEHDLCINPRTFKRGFSGLIGSDELEEFLAI